MKLLKLNIMNLTLLTISFKKKAFYTTILLVSLFSTDIFSQTYVPGTTYYDSSGYIEYRAGNLPIILSAPHGGSKKPYSIPSRNCSGCVYVRDTWTQEVTEEIYDEFVAKTGKYPHVIINTLHRTKLDANRDVGDAADGNAIPTVAWYNYHSFIQTAKNKINSGYGKGLFLDIHAHAHQIQRIELGYMLTSSELRLSDTALNSNNLIAESSLKSLVANNIDGYTHAALIRGTKSFGTLLSGKGFPSVPSLPDPSPNVGEPYFNGGYNTARHGSRDNNGNIDAIQIETNSTARSNSTVRSELANAIMNTAIEYMDLHYNSQILGISNQNIEQFNFKIYPNPAKSYFNLESNLKNIEIKIYNNLGQLVHSEIFSNKKIKIDFLPNGYYFVKVRKDNTVLANLKLMKF